MSAKCVYFFELQVSVVGRTFMKLFTGQFMKLFTGQSFTRQDFSMVQQSLQGIARKTVFSHFEWPKASVCAYHFGLGSSLRIWPSLRFYHSDKYGLKRFETDESTSQEYDHPCRVDLATSAKIGWLFTMLANG